MSSSPGIVFLLDVDNTLLDNDAVAADLRRHLEEAFGAEREERYWQIFEDQRAALGYADYLGALQRYRVEYPRDTHLVQVSLFLVDYPFTERLYPGALELVARLGDWGLPVILTDGDVVFQPRKIDRSGLLAAVRHRALVYVHKEQMLDDVERRYPAGRYVLVDDKLRILDAVKRHWGDRVITVWPRQGHYALDPKIVAAYPAPDVTLERVTDLTDDLLARLFPGSPAPR